MWHHLTYADNKYGILHHQIFRFHDILIISWHRSIIYYEMVPKFYYPPNMRILNFLKRGIIILPRSIAMKTKDTEGILLLHKHYFPKKVVKL